MHSIFKSPLLHPSTRNYTPKQDSLIYVCTLCFPLKLFPNLFHFLTFVLLFPFFSLLPLTKFFQVARSSIFSYTTILFVYLSPVFFIILLPRISEFSTIFCHRIISSPFAVSTVSTVSTYLSTYMRSSPVCRWDLAELWMRSSRMVRVSDSQCVSRNCPGFYPSILPHSGIWGAAGEAMLNKELKKSKKISP